MFDLGGEAPVDKLRIGDGFLGGIDDAHLEATPLGTREELVRCQSGGDEGHGLAAGAEDRLQLLVLLQHRKVDALPPGAFEQQRSGVEAFKQPFRLKPFVTADEVVRAARWHAGIHPAAIGAFELGGHGLAGPGVAAGLALDGFPAIPVVDTIKRVRDGVVVDTPARDELVAVQTPQGFRTGILRAAHANEDPDITDDAMRVERAGIPVRVVAGSQRGFKITTPFDLAVAATMIEDR